MFHNWAVREGFGKCSHGEQVAASEPAHVREGFLEVGGEPVNDFGTPGGLLLAGEDDFSSLPVGFDDDGVGRQNGADASTAEVGLYLLKRGGVALGQRRGSRRNREDRFGPGATTGKTGVIRFFRAGF